MTKTVASEKLSNQNFVIKIIINNLLFLTVREDEKIAINNRSLANDR